MVAPSSSAARATARAPCRPWFGCANEGELILTWSRLNAPSGYTWNELGVLPNICTSKIADVGQLNASSVDFGQGTLMRWHALRNPTHQEVSDLRKVCPPGDTSPERDVEIATRLLRDRTLYAHAVQAATQQATARLANRRLDVRLDMGGPATSLPAFQEFALPGIGTRPWPSRPRS